MTAFFKSRIFWIGSFIALVLMFFIINIYFIIGANNLKTVESDLNTRLQSANAENSELDAEYKFLQTDHGIEMLAREYGLDFEGEFRYNVIISG